MIRAVIWAAALLLGLAAAGSAWADERIRSFHADISVAADGTVAVSERITILSEGDRIRRGIFRDIPTDYRDRYGNRVSVDLDVRGVTRDGNEEPWSIETLSDGLRIRIGDADVLLEPGLHTYTIDYVTTRQIGFFDGFDELYWNVTGNGWDFPIDAASATVRLPPGTQILQSATYTGAAGETGTNAVAVQEETGVMTFRTGALLAAGEGFTVAVGFEKGAVTPPSSAERAEAYASDNASVIVALLGLALVAAYYMWAWRRFGVDPARGVIVPQFAPPAGLTPQAVRYVRDMGYDNRCFGAAIIDLAVRGILTIEEQDGGLFVLNRRKEADIAALPASERAFAEALFSGGSVLALKPENHAIVGKAEKILQAKLRGEHDRKHFVTNITWFGIGLALTIAVLVAMVAVGGMGVEAGFMALWIGGWSMGCLALGRMVAHAWTSVFDGRGTWALEIVGAVFLTLFAMPFFAALGLAIWLSATMVQPLAMVVFGVTAALNVIFFFLLKAPTAAGAKLLDAIDGFAMYLSTAERERLRILHPPHMTPQVFERFLPYALALGVENEWSEAFAAEMAAAATAPAVTDAAPETWSPLWYTGSRWDMTEPTRFMSGLGTSLVSAASSAASPPGSSSGSGGGGFSGGGGGGGGGGGW